MKISKEEIKKLADNINIPLTDDEVNEILTSIEEITKTLDDMLDIQTDGNRKIMGNEEISNVYSSNQKEGSVEDLVNTLNNYEDGYISVNKVEESDE